MTDVEDLTMDRTEDLYDAGGRGETQIRRNREVYKHPDACRLNDPIGFPPDSNMKDSDSTSSPATTSRLSWRNCSKLCPAATWQSRMTS